VSNFVNYSFDNRQRPELVSFRHVNWAAAKNKRMFWRWHMPDYRLYTLDSRGHFTSGENLVFGGDEQAMEYAWQLLQLHSSVEVWQGDRQVGQVPQEVYNAWTPFLFGTPHENLAPD
jgi:hypothetical protein